MNKISTQVEPLGVRIKELIRHYGINMNSLSVKLRLPSNSIITRVVKDPSRTLSLENIQRILIEFPEVSARWLVLGEGAMIRGEKLPEKEEEKKPCENCAKLEAEIKSLRQDKEDLRANVADLRTTIENLRDTFGLKKNNISV